MPNLLQYVSSGNYYGRIKVRGKLIRQSLDTDVWSTAKLNLTDFLKKHQGAGARHQAPKFTEAVDLYQKDLKANNNMKPRSKEYRLGCIQKLQRTWPALWEQRLDEVRAQDCKDWATKLSKEVASQYFNNMIGTLRLIIDRGIKEHKEQTGEKLENPAEELRRNKVKQKDLQLPEPEHFKELVKNLRLKSGGWGPRVADLIEFLAYSGMRIRSEALWVTWDDVDWKRNEIVVRGDPVTATKNSEIRRIPIFENMKKLLKSLKGQRETLRPGRILQVTRCYESLDRVCAEVGIPRLTHHDFRHLYATRCIEAGVDIPTVARWLGHKDGGALAMKTYGHLRNEHSQEMAKKVKF